MIENRLKMAAQALLKGSAPPIPRRNIPPICQEEVEEAKSFFPLGKFFIFGHARSGTTLLTRLIRVHPFVHCNYQGHFFTRSPFLEGMVASEEMEKWLTRRSNRWNLGRDLSPVVLRAACDFIMERDARRVGKHHSGCVVGDKSPNSLFDGEAVLKLAKIYPDGSLIFIVRDGRDAAISHRFQAFIDRPQHLAGADAQIREEFMLNPESFLNGTKSIFTEKSLRHAAEGWVNNVVETDDAAKHEFGKQYLSLRYEAILASPHEELRRTWRFLGVDPAFNGVYEVLEAELQNNPDADWQHEKAGEVAVAIQKGRLGTWRELFTPRDKLVFKEIAGKTLVEWGYEHNLDW
jgi:hypothetical protein